MAFSTLFSSKMKAGCSQAKPPALSQLMLTPWFQYHWELMLLAFQLYHIGNFTFLKCSCHGNSKVLGFSFLEDIWRTRWQCKSTQRHDINVQSSAVFKLKKRWEENCHSVFSQHLPRNSYWTLMPYLIDSSIPTLCSKKWLRQLESSKLLPDSWTNIHNMLPSFLITSSKKVSVCWPWG